MMTDLPEIKITTNDDCSALLSKYQYYRELFHNSPWGFHEADAEETIIEINDTELKWLGYRRDEVVGKMKVTQLLTEKGRISFAKHSHLIREKGSVSDVEVEFQ